MAENQSVSKKKVSADWLFRGVLTKVGDTVDRFTGRRWIPSSSLATSELIERMKKLMDAEAKDVPGKGLVVPHNVSLKMQWNKFSEDSEKAIAALKTELTVAAIDHINDSLYHTFAPIFIDVKTDYFTEGVKLMVSFDAFDDEVEGVEMNVSMPALNVGNVRDLAIAEAQPAGENYIATFTLSGAPVVKKIATAALGRISVGRTGENDLAIDDISVSKRHAALVVGADGSLSVADTGSTNGTFINGERVAYGKSVALAAADLVRFGSIEVSFEHVPRPIEIPIADEPSEPKSEVFKIDGFEFTSRETPESPVAAAPPADSIREPEKIAGDEALPKTAASVNLPIPPPNFGPAPGGTTSAKPEEGDPTISDLGALSETISSAAAPPISAPATAAESSIPMPKRELTLPSTENPENSSGGDK